MNGATVFLVHGIWMPGTVMALLGRRLAREHGYDAQLFSYPSVRGTLDQNADRLSRAIQAHGSRVTHVVGHSLGGVVALRMLARHAHAVPGGRVVCLGSPLGGSRAAAALARHAWGRSVAGRTLSAGVIDEPAGSWAATAAERRDVGIIAGTLPVGFGAVLARFDGDHDGTVAVSETRLVSARDHLCLPVSHMGLVVSRRVADQTAAFLRCGRFARYSSAAALRR